MNTFSIASIEQRLVESIGQYKRVVVAFSGGVDSSVIAKAAYQAHQDGLLHSAIAVTAVSPSVATWQLEIATEVASQIGIEHQTIQTREMDSQNYLRNDHRRCFHCKQTLYQTMQSMLGTISQSHGDAVLLSGTNADDAGDYRPGIEAGSLAGVKTPLLDLGIGKATVRKIASRFGLANADLPASPCLASRIAYGTPVTTQRLKRIDRAESWLREHGFDVVRVRTQQVSPVNSGGDHARIEVDSMKVELLDELNQDEFVVTSLKRLGFESVSLDPAGFRSGNLNDALDVVPLSLGKGGATRE